MLLRGASRRSRRSLETNASKSCMFDSAVKCRKFYWNSRTTILRTRISCTQLLQEDPHFAAFLLDSAKTIVALEATSRNPGKLPVERWRQESPFKQFHDDILERYRMNLPPAGRLRDAFLAAAKYADGHVLQHFVQDARLFPDTSLNHFVFFQIEEVTRDTLISGHGKAFLRFKAGVEVLVRKQ